MIVTPCFAGAKPVASLVPVEPSRSGVTLVDLREIMQQLPHLDSNDQTFTADVMAGLKQVRKSVGKRS